jgi:hypothetical protein
MWAIIRESQHGLFLRAFQKDHVLEGEIFNASLKNQKISMSKGQFHYLPMCPSPYIAFLPLVSSPFSYTRHGRV